MNNKRNLLIMIITLSLVLILGSSYAYLMYTKESNNSYVINVGTLEVTFVDSKTQFLNLTNMYPMTDEEGKSLEQELVFQVKNTGNLVANYNVYIEELSTEPEFKTVIKYIVNKDNKGYSEPKILNEDKYIENNGKLKVGETSEYHVKVWLDETADNTYMNKEFKAKVVVEGNQVLEKSFIDKLDDTNSITDEDGTIYLSGDNETINFNYVWYSGKLWRITAINPDGSMKLVTQDEITAINWGADTTYENSWIYQWLNEDFKDTLYNYEEIIVQNTSWNVTEDKNSTPARPPIDDSTATKITGDVGLLNVYEYYQSYKNVNYSNGYLNIGYIWWLITPYSGTNVRYVQSNGSLFAAVSSSYAYGVRPSINLKSNIEIVSGGDGSETNPYRISGDKEPGNSGELINTRLNGEYVKVDNRVYRIVGIENRTTKLTSIDYIRDDSGAVLTKNFGSNVSWATSVATDSDDKYWSYYLNNIWLTSELENYITTGTYYLGQVGSSSSYKNSICSESNTTDPTSSCTRTTSTWQGLVGLSRVGEMFSAMLGKGYDDTSTYIWLMTPYSVSDVRNVYNYGYSSSDTPSSRTYGVRPSISLNSNVIITGGDGMSPESAYTIGLS